MDQQITSRAPLVGRKGIVFPAGIRKREVLGRIITYSPLYDTDRIENDTSNNSSIVASVFVSARVFTEPLPSNDIMIYIPCFIKIYSGIEKLIEGIHRQHGDHIRLLLFCGNEESRQGSWSDWLPIGVCCITVKLITIVTCMSVTIDGVWIGNWIY
jgi:hypothetical protein